MFWLENKKNNDGADMGGNDLFFKVTFLTFVNAHANFYQKQLRNDPNYKMYLNVYFVLSLELKDESLLSFLH